MKNIAVIGLGNVGSHLGDKLVDAGFNVSEIVHRKLDESAHFKRRWSSKIMGSPSDITSELAIICVQDRYIEAVVKQLPENTTALVTSGTFDLSAAFPNRKTGIFYPLQTFTKNRSVDWNNIPVLLESESKEVMAEMKCVAKKMSISFMECRTQERQGYHLAAVWVNNFVNFILEQANLLCNERELNFQFLEPLLSETIHKNLNSNGISVQTGPAIRGDEATILTHLGLLQGDQRELYKTLTEFIQKKQKDA